MRMAHAMPRPSSGSAMTSGAARCDRDRMAGAFPSDRVGSELARAAGGLFVGLLDAGSLGGIASGDTVAAGASLLPASSGLGFGGGETVVSVRCSSVAFAPGGLPVAFDWQLRCGRPATMTIAARWQSSASAAG
jgi:hypothetical protein